MAAFLRLARLDRGKAARIGLVPVKRLPRAPSKGLREALEAALAIGLACALVPSSAMAGVHRHGRHYRHHHHKHHRPHHRRIHPGAAPVFATSALRPQPPPAPPSCPSGMPVQVLTVVDDAAVDLTTLGQVEQAVTDQSVELNAAWGTPCVQWNTGGWSVYLEIGTPDVTYGTHCWPGVECSASPTGGATPYVAVQTGGSGRDWWSRTFSHEVV